MSASVETTAAMTTPAKPDAAVGAHPVEPHEPHDSPAADQAETVAAVGTAGEQAVATSKRAGSARDASRRGERHEREPVSTNVVLAVLGGLITALLTGMITLQVWQFNSLGNSIESLGTRIDQQGAELRSEIGKLDTRIDKEGADLRAEMQAGFREINEILLDHTDRLARLETAIGLSRPDHWAVVAP